MIDTVDSVKALVKRGKKAPLKKSWERVFPMPWVSVLKRYPEHYRFNGKSIVRTASHPKELRNEA